MDLVREEVDRNNIPANRIVLGGFSQGCVLSLLTALTSEYRFAGVTALSGYLPLHTKIMTMVSDANRKTPIFWGHGDADQVNRAVHVYRSFLNKCLFLSCLCLARNKNKKKNYRNDSSERNLVR